MLKQSTRKIHKRTGIIRQPTNTGELTKEKFSQQYQSSLNTGQVGQILIDLLGTKTARIQFDKIRQSLSCIS